MEPLNYNPPSLFWIAYYRDGTCYPQFDPLDGGENRWSNVDQEKLQAVGWHPFNRELAEKIKSKGLIVSINPFMRNYKLTLAQGEVAIVNTEQKIHEVTLLSCLKCGYRWQPLEKPGELGYPNSVEIHYMETKKGQKFASYVCPGCGAFTEHVCPECKIERTKYADGLRCSECKRDQPDLIGTVSFEERHTTYLLGKSWIEKVRDGAARDGVKINRVLIRIDEKGNVEMT